MIAAFYIALFLIEGWILLVHVPATLGHAFLIPSLSSWKWLLASVMSKTIATGFFGFVFLLNRIYAFERRDNLKLFLALGTLICIGEIVLRKMIHAPNGPWISINQATSIPFVLCWHLFWGLLAGVIFGYCAYLRYQFG